MENISKSIIRRMKFLSVLIISLGIFVGCGDVLNNVEDLSGYPEEGTFNNVESANAYLANLYSSTLPGWPVNQGNNADVSGGIIGPDYITIQNGTFKPWPYSTIREINIMLEQLPNSQLDEDEKASMQGQAKFLRAYNYFQMVYHYGGVPILKEPQQLSETLEVSRSSTEETFDFIIQDLNDAIDALPPKYGGSDRGKIDKAAALAFKGRVMLYKASPQFNPSDPYNNQYWQEAYIANKEAKDFLDANGYGLLESYTDVFETEGHKENILSVIYQDPAKTNGRREDGVRPLSESKNATGMDEPVWSLAQAYPMKDGYMPGDAASDYSYDLQNFWENRDPRFKANLVWNGAVYELSGKTGRRQYTMENIAASVDAFGFTIQGESFDRSGLYCRKGIMEELPQAQVSTNDVDWPEIRYAEVLFNYAEAANETGRTAEAVQILKDIRERAGIEPGSNNMYGLAQNMNRQEAREAILHEKYIEMAFEGHRFWDLRRHRMLDRIDGMHKYGIMATEVNGRSPDEVTAQDKEKAANYELLPSDFTYEVVELLGAGPKEMAMPEKYYFFPIQLYHLDRNSKLEQNEGWGGSFDPTL